MFSFNSERESNASRCKPPLVVSDCWRWTGQLAIGMLLLGSLMQLTIHSKVTYGVLLLALGLMLTDLGRLLRAPSEATLSAANSTQQVRKF